MSVSFFNKNKKRMSVDPEEFEAAKEVLNQRPLHDNSIVKIKKHGNQQKHSFIKIFDRRFLIANKSENKIGQGGINKVKFCQDENGQIYSVRIAKLPPERYQLLEQSILNQWEILNKLNLLIAGCIVGNKSYTVTPYFEGESYSHYRIRLASNNKEESKEAKYEFALRAAWEVYHCHHNQIVHNDIKSTNFIINFNDNYRTKLIDFDGGFNLDAVNQTHGQYVFYYTPAYTAPEVQNSLRNASKKSDVFSLGLLFQKIGITSKIVQKMTEREAQQRSSIKKIIQLLQKKKDKSKKKTYWTNLVFNAFCSCIFYLSYFSVYGFSYFSLFCIFAPFMLHALKNTVLYVRWAYQKNAFKELIGNDNEYDLDNKKLEDLDTSNSKNIRLGFDAGGHLGKQALTFLYGSAYSKAYYAGLRLKELNPQKEFKENPEISLEFREEEAKEVKSSSDSMEKYLRPWFSMMV